MRQCRSSGKCRCVNFAVIELNEMNVARGKCSAFNEISYSYSTIAQICNTRERIAAFCNFEEEMRFIY